jgi:hypothetical protein
LEHTISGAKGLAEPVPETRSEDLVAISTAGTFLEIRDEAHQLPDVPTGFLFARGETARPDGRYGSLLTYRNLLSAEESREVS